MYVFFYSLMISAFPQIWKYDNEKSISTRTKTLSATNYFKEQLLFITLFPKKMCFINYN